MKTPTYDIIGSTVNDYRPVPDNKNVSGCHSIFIFLSTN